MDVSPRRQPPTVRLRRLAAELRRLRAAGGLTREQVSEQTAINSATLYRIETAKLIWQMTIGTTEYALREITIAPGGRTGWHYHDGPVYGLEGI